MSRQGRSLDQIELAPWRFIGFSDLHYGAKTAERGLQALAGVREYALHYGATVVFTGDFWDTRGVLGVRHVSALMDEFHRWRDARISAVLIPGNHDQVSVDGVVHSVRIFEPFPNITVATKRVLWPERKIAFIPWRQDPAEQAEQFELEGKDWTIFGHAEVAGARTNHGHKAPGRVTVAQIRKHARACYLGHYHLRQQMGDRTWYLGTPFEQDFGEMGNATGCALITPDQIEPHWLVFPDFPRHHRVTYQVPFDVGVIAAQDIVEVYAPPSDLKTAEFASFRASIPAADTRSLPLKAGDDESAEPLFALSLDEAIDRYVDAAAPDPGEGEQLKGLARAVLGELPETRAVLGMSPRVDVLGVTSRDFCALRGEVALDLGKRGLVMLRGPVGVGKTALADIITWVLYDRTSPRKAGAHAATFRGDEVINDHADSCEGAVRLRLHDGAEILVTREKARGKGSKAHVQGVEAPEGISDTTRLIEHVIGMDYGMWRTCVSLGQGAVGNFVTDADKSRKELLSQAFGLGACPPAQKLVRSRLKALVVQREKFVLDMTSETRAVETLRSTDYTEQIRLWEEQRAATELASQSRGEVAKERIVGIDEQLKAEPQWLELRVKHQTHLDVLLKELGALTVGDAALAKEREMGAVEAEKSLAVRDLSLLKPVAEKLEIEFQKRQGVPCPTCGQPMPVAEAEKMVAAKHKECDRLERAIRSFGAKLGNMQNDLGNLKRGGAERRGAIDAEVSESRKALEKIGDALSAFARLRANRESQEDALEESRAVWNKHHAMINPFDAKQAEIGALIEKCESVLEEMREEASVADDQIKLLSFWDEGFGVKGLAVLVLTTALYELETHANHFLGQLLKGTVWVQLVMAGDDLKIRLFENKGGTVRERRYEQLSGGQRRCVELAFAPFALSEMVFNRCGVRVPLMIIDELTTHLGAEEKPLVCDILRGLDRDTILVIDHDAQVQGQFDVVLDVEQGPLSVIVSEGS